MKIFELKKSERAHYQEQIVRLEKKAFYPLGEDSFCIDHGKDYFAFFDRLGETHYFICTINDQVVAVAAGVIRQIPKKVFYLCDLKVHPDFRGKKIPLKILAYGALRYYLKCPRGYAISMNGPNQKENRIAKLLKNFRWIKISPTETLSIYSFGHNDMRTLRALIEQYKGPLTFLTLSGVKDLILESTKMPMKLLHIRYGNDPLGDSDLLFNDPLEDHVHMMALTSSDLLKKEFDQLNIRPSSSATIVGHNMRVVDWGFIRSSDI